MIIRPVGAEFHADGQMDGRMNRYDEASSHFSQFCKAPNKEKCPKSIYEDTLIWSRIHISATTAKGKVFPLQAWAGPWVPGRLRLPDFLYFRRYEGGKVVTLTHRPSLPPGVSWHSFLEAESTPGHMVPSVASEKFPSETTGDRSRDPPSSSAVP
jgi:hypothetical protein